MRKLKANEEFVEVDKDGKPKIYNNSYTLIRVKCPNEQSYITTIDDWEQKDFGNRTIYNVEDRLMDKYIKDKLKEV